MRLHDFAGCKKFVGSLGQAFLSLSWVHPAAEAEKVTPKTGFPNIKIGVTSRTSAKSAVKKLAGHGNPEWSSNIRAVFFTSNFS